MIEWRWFFNQSRTAETLRNEEVLRRFNWLRMGISASFNNIDKWRILLLNLSTSDLLFSMFLFAKNPLQKWRVVMTFVVEILIQKILTSFYTVYILLAEGTDCYLSSQGTANVQTESSYFIVFCAVASCSFVSTVSKCYMSCCSSLISQTSYVESSCMFHLQILDVASM